MASGSCWLSSTLSGVKLVVLSWVTPGKVVLHVGSLLGALPVPSEARTSTPSPRKAGQPWAAGKGLAHSRGWHSWSCFLLHRTKTGLVSTSLEGQSLARRVTRSVMALALGCTGKGSPAVDMHTVSRGDASCPF